MRPLSLLRLCAAFALSLLVGCGGGDGFNNNPTTRLPLQITPATVNGTPGQPVLYTVTAQSATLPAAPVVLSVTGLPPNAAAVFNPPQIGLSAGALTGASQLTITLDRTTPTGSYPLTIQGNTGNAAFGTAQTVLNVPQVGNQQSFTLTVNPPSTTVFANAPANFNIMVTPTNGFSGTVTLSISGGGGDVNVSNPAPGILTLNGTQPENASFSVSRAPGAIGNSSATLTITATGGSVTQTTTVIVETRP